MSEKVSEEVSEEGQEVSEVMRCVLLCMLEAVEGGLCSLEALEVLEMLDTPKVMRYVVIYMLEALGESVSRTLQEMLVLTQLLKQRRTSAMIIGDVSGVTWHQMQLD